MMFMCDVIRVCHWVVVSLAGEWLYTLQVFGYFLGQINSENSKEKYLGEWFSGLWHTIEELVITVQHKKLSKVNNNLEMFFFTNWPHMINIWIFLWAVRLSKHLSSLPCNFPRAHHSNFTGTLASPSALHPTIFQWSLESLHIGYSLYLS